MPPNDKRTDDSGNEALAVAIGKAMADAIKNTRSDTTGLSPDQVARLEGMPAPKRWREVACKSEWTGATFIACVVESKAHPHGRIVELKNYTHPQGVSTFTSAGGLVPEGMQIMRAGTGAPPEDGRIIPKHDLTPFYMQWRYTEFWQRDINMYAGKELRSSMAIDPAAFTTPWKEGSVRVDLSEAV